MILTPIEMRHCLHKEPELSFREYKTTKILEENIKNIAKKYESNILFHYPLDTGFVVESKVNEGKFLLFRADIDALPIKEETHCEFASTNESMHACGHDVHASILYGFIEYVLCEKIDQNFLFIFQPGEEAGGGAENIIKSGIIDQFDIHFCYATHVTDEYDEGTIASTSGVLFASCMEINLDFEGTSAHVAFPQNGNNAFFALRIFFDAIEKLPQNPLEPFVFSIGKVTSGDVRNIIPGHARAEGTLRTLDGEKSKVFLEKLKEIAKAQEIITGVKCQVSQGSFYPQVINDDYLFRQASRHLAKSFNFLDCGYKMTGEDFAYLSLKYPSLMIWLGTKNGKSHGLHNARFLPSDSVVSKGIEIYKRLMKIS